VWLFWDKMRHKEIPSFPLSGSNKIWQQQQRQRRSCWLAGCLASFQNLTSRRAFLCCCHCCCIWIPSAHVTPLSSSRPPPSPAPSILHKCDFPHFIPYVILLRVFSKCINIFDYFLLFTKYVGILSSLQLFRPLPVHSTIASINIFMNWIPSRFSSRTLL